MNDNDWTEFINSVNARLQQGAKEYGDKSFLQSPEHLLKELEEETLDIAGWSFIMWCRLINMRAKVEKATHSQPTSKPYSYVVQMVKSYFVTDKELN